MNKLESIQLAESNVVAAREAYEAAVFGLRDAQLLPEPPALKTWEVNVPNNASRHARTESGDYIQDNLPQVLSSWPGILPDIIEGDANKARCVSASKPASLCVVYSNLSAEGEWTDEPACNIEWSEVV
jgi:hypothetical protein